MEMKQVYENANERMHKTIRALNGEYDSIRAGRANASVLDKIQVDYYGVPTPINQPWDASTLHAIEKAIQTSDLGINPQNDGRVLRLIFPPLTEDHRKELVKTVGKTAEEAKVAIRSIRRDCIEKLKAMKKGSEITEDDLKDGENELQKITDKFTKEIDSIAQAKEKEIMEI